MSIRLYKPTDYMEIISWWSSYGEIVPEYNSIPEESTFIYEKNGEPWICLSLLLTNTKALAIVDNFVSNPNIEDNRDLAVKELFVYAEYFAKQRGYKKFLGITKFNGIAERSKELGFTLMSDNSKIIIKGL